MTKQIWKMMMTKMNQQNKIYSHVFPLNDLKEHILSGSNCSCNPTIDDNGIVIHNSFDRREIWENLMLQ
jgi:hypothetical protein